MDIAEKIQLQAQEYEKKLQLLRDNKIVHLIARKSALLKELAQVESEITGTCTLLGITLDDGKAKAKPETRTRMSSEEIRTRVINILAANPQGISQKEIEKKTGVTYPSVINFLKDNPEKIRTEGERKSKRVFLIVNE